MPKKYMAVVAVAGVGVASMVAGLCGGVSHADGNASAIIGHGYIGRAQWAAWVRDGPASHGGVCVRMVFARPASVGLNVSETNECTNVQPSKPVLESVVSGYGRKRRLVFVVLFSGSTREVFLNLGRRGTRRVKIRRLDKNKAARLGIEQIGFWAHGFSGDVCLRRFIGYDASGAVLSDSGKLRCD